MRPLLLGPLTAIAAALFTTCGTREPHNAPPHDRLRPGPWRMELDLRTSTDPGPVILPFTFEVITDSIRGQALRIHNGAEAIDVDELRIDGDSIRVHMPLFDSEFIGQLHGDTAFSGKWFNYLKGPTYSIPFAAKAGRAPRFPGQADGHERVAGTWACHFAPGTPDAYDAVGLFEATADRVTGTFGTETGDHRFLEGGMRADSFLLSSFDGSHAYLFRALLRNDSLVGEFRSGIHSVEHWQAVRDPDFQLRDPDSLTFLKEGYDMVDIRLPNLNGDTISLMDARFNGRVRMVQIMGSWCPNCMDESRLLAQMHERYHASGLDVVAVAFEREADPLRAVEMLKRYQRRLHIPYDILYAGSSNKESVAEKLPFLDHLMSYPTCIFIDRMGKVRRIRTGFYGPSTGLHYRNYQHNLEQFLERMLAEPAP